MNKKTVAILYCILNLFSACQSPQEDQGQIKQDQEIEKARLYKEQARLDSLNINISRANVQLEHKKFDTGIQLLDSALVYAVGSETNELNYQKAKAYFELRKYENSIGEYSKLISAEYNLKETYYLRALCYQKERKIQESVNDLRKAVEFGNVDAEKLHEKINPIKNRVSYYVTRCCDGTTSDATGRGACSHHGGVCDWNDPVYEEYRKY